jgi:hypothetical protein
VTGLRPSVDRRIRVLIVRRRLEELAATLVEQSAGIRPQRHRFVAHRLMLLVAAVPDDEWPALYGLAHRATVVYADTSTVLHSNRAFGDTPEQLVQEWEQVATDVAEAVAQQAVDSHYWHHPRAPLGNGGS